MTRKIWPAVAVLFGVVIIAATTQYIILGVKHPSGDNSIAIALLSAVGVPIALGAIAAGGRGFRGPNAAMLKTEAEAKRRAAAALEDAKNAEKIKSELEAYVAVRTWRLEIERKRQELSRTVNAALGILAELNEDETRLGVEKTKLSPVTVETLDTLLRPSATPDVLDVVSSAITALSPAGGQFGEILLDWYYEYSQKRRLRRIAHLAPEALATQADDDRSSAGS